MRARPRKDIVGEDQVGYDRCYNRCVPRSFLCGVDPRTGNNSEHRKSWIRQRLDSGLQHVRGPQPDSRWQGGEAGDGSVHLGLRTD